MYVGTCIHLYTYSNATGKRDTTPLIGNTTTIEVGVPLPVIGSIDATALQLEKGKREDLSFN